MLVFLVALALAVGSTGTLLIQRLTAHPASATGAATASGSAATVSPRTTANMIACTKLWTPGTTIPRDLAEVGCLEANGHTEIFGEIDCKDGSKLFGDNRFWGYAGKITHVVVGDVADDKGYAEAWHTCLN
jgi:hypothetical protein